MLWRSLGVRREDALHLATPPSALLQHTPRRLQRAQFSAQAPPSSLAA